MSWERVELWWAMILDAIPHIILKKSSSYNRLSKNSFFLKFTERIAKKPKFNFLRPKNESSHIIKKQDVRIWEGLW